MSSLFPRTVSAPEPSPLLTHLAGEAAPAVATLWAPPHAAYLAAPASRRHLLGVAVAEGVDLSGEAADVTLAAPLKRAVTTVLTDPPEGFPRALGRLGEVGWPLESYRRLLRLLRHPQAAKALRHAAALHPGAVDRLADAPPPLLSAGLARLDLGHEAMTMVQQAYEALVLRDGAEEAARFAAEWGGARKPSTLFRRIEADLLRAIPAPAFAPSTRLRWLTTQAAIRDAATRYRNCLRGYLDAAARGRSVLGEWLEPPGAILEVTMDSVFGCRLEQARGPGNASVPQAAREAITAELRELGVYVGRSGADLRAAARRAAAGEPRPTHWIDDHEETFEARA